MNQKIRIAAIVAMAENNVIGRDNTLIWHIPGDLKHFKKTTMGKPIIMGRKSYDSIGKPLPGRPNIVVSRSHKDLDTAATPHFSVMESVDTPTAPVPAGPFLYATIEEGIAAAKNLAAQMKVDEIFITGGGEIYRQTMDQIERLYLTLIHRDYEGHTFFPEFDWNDWHITAEERHEGDPAYTFFTLDRK